MDNTTKKTSEEKWRLPDGFVGTLEELLEYDRD